MTRRGLRFGLLGTPVLFGGEPTPGQSPPGRAPRTRDGTPVVPVTSPKLRTLLTVLLLDAGRVVSVEALKDALWGGAPPVSALPSLHNHVARLRRLLGEPGRLLTAPTGYVLRVDDGELDVQVFDAHVSAARSARAEGDWERVRRECRAALGLWRGMPLGGPAPEVGGYALVRRLEEARLLLHEWRYDAELALGDESLADLVPELSALAAEHPLREAYHRQLMLALHRTGRQAEALVVHRDLRARLADELGVEPGQPVREAHVEVLRGSGTRDGASRWVRPAQLPPAPAHFVGRADVREGVARVLSGTDATGAVVLSGTAGVGKTALALQVAHNLEERFSGGQLYLNLRATEPGAKPLTTAEALASLLRDLGVCSGDVPEQPDAASALLRSLLAPSRTLLVLDDAVSAAQVRPLLPAGPGCGVLVTSRSPLTALDGAARFPLRPLSDEESAALLCAASGRDGITARHPLVALTGRLPLALRVVAARLAARRALTPDALAARLAGADSRLDLLDHDDLGVRRSLDAAFDALTASEHRTDQDAALVLRHIGALDLPSYDAPSLARLTGVDEARAEAALERLAGVALLEETAYGRFEPYDLVRDYARERAAEPCAHSASGCHFASA
ncbi:BTAD domain-containing putative transcriptional regulator [Streptomyces cellulosae]|uniref:BTAD domain-containing putative transcriptional regulator n=1 Tax=Streptomyces thermocarboxydus TaxID=59299 RepID=A0ABU3JBB6_9ACTN|nr:BTAD domain-containing putative transcriptional regulator [Streptomyces thermocarboxydus]